MSSICFLTGIFSKLGWDPKVKHKMRNKIQGVWEKWTLLFMRLINLKFGNDWFISFTGLLLIFILGPFICPESKCFS